MFAKKTIKDINVQGKKALVRVDFNVPIKDGKISDDTRIQAALPTIRYLMDHGASVILMSHLGRPKGKVDPMFSLAPVAIHLGKLLGKTVAFADDCIGKSAVDAAAVLKPGEVLLLENTRFYDGDEKNDPEMAKKLANLADIFVNDAFGSAHRAHASTEGVAKFLPAVAGFLMEKEIQYLGEAIRAPGKPFVVILGGAKISDKIGVIRNLLGKADHILIGGAMANTFFKALNYDVADSLAEADAASTASEIIKEGGSKIVLPVDVVIADALDANAQSREMPIGDVPAGWRILDIGPKTVQLYGDWIKTAKTVVWNGPMGVFEFERFAKGTFGIAKAVADSSAVSIIGGGDSVAAIQQSGLTDRITHISTGGGASLEMLEGITLPGLAALQDK
ncbi:MAG: phosphoglycerate kinase [Chloroflexi bacterium]|nr:phosphoglycerate kinase [Chloroflexota bacterium]